jgi:hypothetical protein
MRACQSRCVLISKCPLLHSSTWEKIVLTNITDCDFGQASVAESSVVLPPDERGATMPTYRIFTAGRDAHLSAVPKTLECTDDQEAVENAMRLANGVGLEIWDRERMVALLPGSLSLK